MIINLFQEDNIYSQTLKTPHDDLTLNIYEIESVLSIP